jgi:hypothetical protein
MLELLYLSIIMDIMQFVLELNLEKRKTDGTLQKYFRYDR